MLADNQNVCKYKCNCGDKMGLKVEAELKENRTENNEVQGIIMPFVNGELCYESFFMDCLSRPSASSCFFVGAIDEVLVGLLALQSCSAFAQERDITYFFGGLVFLYVECACETFKSKFVSLLSVFFVKREATYKRYRFLHRHTTFKALLSLVRQSDFRIREFLYNTDFVDVLFELPNDDAVVLMLKWKFVNAVATIADIKLCVLEKEPVKNFIRNNLTTSFGAINSLIKDTLNNAKKSIDNLLTE